MSRSLIWITMGVFSRHFLVKRARLLQWQVCLLSPWNIVRNPIRGFGESFTSNWKLNKTKVALVGKTIQLTLLSYSLSSVCSIGYQLLIEKPDGKNSI